MFEIMTHFSSCVDESSCSLESYILATSKDSYRPMVICKVMPTGSTIAQHPTPITLPVQRPIILTPCCHILTPGTMLCTIINATLCPIIFMPQARLCPTVLISHARLYPIIDATQCHINATHQAVHNHITPCCTPSYHAVHNH